MPTLVLFLAKAGGIALWKAGAIVVGTLATSGTVGYFFGKKKRFFRWKNKTKNYKWKNKTKNISDKWDEGRSKILPFFY